MDYVLRPSLERMTLTKIAVALWIQEDVMAPMPMEHLEWLEAEDEVIKKVPGLPLPKPLKEKVLKFISGIGWEIFKMRQHLYYYYYLDRVLPSELCWTPHGTVDTKKTAEAIIQNENIDVTRRYKLACNYCLEDDIPKLFEKLPELFRRKGFHSELDSISFVEFWTHRMKGEMDKPDDEIKRRWGNFPYQRAFQWAAMKGNKAATEYFLQKLTHEEREVLLVETAKEVVYNCREVYHPSKYGNVLFFLFSVMDKRQQMEMFKDEPQRFVLGYCLNDMLGCLLDWPWESFFMKTVNHVWDTLSEEDFRHLILIIVDRLRNGRRECDYRKLFVEFWQQSTNAHKKRVIDKLKTDLPVLLTNLFEIEDMLFVRLILNSATVEERKDIIFCRGGNRACEILIGTDEWDSVKLYLQEFLTSKEVMTEFKEEFKEHIAREISERSAKYMKKEYDRFFQLIDDLIQDFNNKRSAEEDGESTLFKRHLGTESEGVTHSM